MHNIPVLHEKYPFFNRFECMYSLGLIMKDLIRVYTLSEKKVQKLSLGLYLFKRYTFVTKGCILIP